MTQLALGGKKAGPKEGPETGNKVFFLPKTRDTGAGEKTIREAIKSSQGLG